MPQYGLETSLFVASCTLLSKTHCQLSAIKGVTGYSFSSDHGYKQLHLVYCFMHMC